MKRIISVAVVFFALVGSALASAPESAQSLLIQGNQQYVLKKNAAEGVVAAVVADPAIAVNPAELFGLAEARIATYRPAAFGSDADVAGLGIDLTAPLYVVLGQDAESVWATYLAVVKAAPDLIYAVMKGQTSVIGAIYNAETGAVTTLGAHPDLLVLAGQHILGVPLTPTAAPVAEAKTEEAPAEQPQAAEAKTEAPEAAHAPAEADHAAPAAGHETASEGGSSGPLAIVLFIVALIGTVIFMDKTVLKP